MTGQSSLCEVTGIFTVSFNLTTLCLPPTATIQHCAGMSLTALLMQDISARLSFSHQQENTVLGMWRKRKVENYSIPS